MSFAVYGQAAQSHAIDQRIVQLQQQNAAIRQEIAARQREIQEAQTPAWLEEEARKLGYVLPGERVFVVAPSGAAVPPAGGVTAPLPSFSPLPSAPPSGSATPAASPTPRPSPTAIPLGSPQPSPRPSATP